MRATTTASPHKKATRNATTLLTLLFLVALTLPFSNAVPTNGISYYEMFTTTDSWNSYTLTNSGVSSVANYPSFAVSGDGASSSGNFVAAESDYMYRNSVISDFPFSINLWFRTDTTLGYLFMIGDSGSNDDYYALLADADHLSIIRKVGGLADIQDFTNTTYNTATWYMATAVFSSTTDTKYYLNGKTVGLDTDSKGFPGSTDIFCLGVLCRSSITSYFNGYIDEVQVFSKTLSYIEIQQLYDYGTITTNNAPTIILYTPTNNTHLNNNNVTFKYNITDEDGDDMNCSVVVDNTVVNNLLNSGDSNTTRYGTVATGTHEWRVNCTDGTDTTTSNNYTLIIDTTNPLYTGISPLTDNTTVIDKKDGDEHNFSGYWSDTYMYAWNLTIKYPNGSTAYEDNDTGLTGSKEWVNHTLNISAWPNGEYTYLTYGSDDHTAKEIPEYDVEIRSDSITYDTGSAEITITSLFETTNIETTKELDRYTWTYDTDGEKGKVSFTLTSNKKIWYRGTLYPYPSFVTGENWVDFDMVGADVKYTVQKKSDYEYELELEVEEKVEENNEFTFNSIGGLNIAGKTATFNITATSDLTVRAKSILSYNTIAVFNLTLANGTTRSTTNGHVTLTGLTPANYSYTLRSEGYQELETWTDTLPTGEYDTTKYMTPETASSTVGGAIKESVLLLMGVSVYLLFLLLAWLLHRHHLRGGGISYITGLLVVFVGALALYLIDKGYALNSTVKNAMLILYAVLFIYIVYTSVKDNNV